MSEYKPITQGLRDYVMSRVPLVRGEIIEYCDNIDAIHMTLEAENAEMRPFVESLEEAAESHKDVTLWGVDYMPYPVDADGVPIRMGDVIAYKDNTKPMQVLALVPPSVVMVEDGPRFADMCRHYHKSTVADVLREFAEIVAGHRALYTSGAIEADERQEADERAIKHYAKRLQLAEVADGSDSE